MVVVVSKVVLLARGTNVGFVPTNSFTERFKRVILIPTPLVEVFRSPIEYFPVGFTVTGSKFWVYETFPSRHDV